MGYNVKDFVSEPSATVRSTAGEREQVLILLYELRTTVCTTSTGNNK